jgi:hypothetical protein
LLLPGYRIRREGARVQIWLNGLQTVDSTEADAGVAQDGQIALQIHGGGKGMVSFRDIEVQEL